MSPRRGPDGKFVSGSSISHWSDVHSFHGSLATTIPAADLSGGTTTVTVAGDAMELVSFTEHLDNDEIFDLRLLQGSVNLAMPTTATAEGSSELQWNLRTGYGDATVYGAGHWSGGVGKETGIADILQADTHDDSIIASGRLIAENSHSDTVNALAAGADSGFQELRIPFGSLLGAGPSFDADDELTVPHDIAIDNVSDHSVVATFDVSLFGTIEELD